MRLALDGEALGRMGAIAFCSRECLFQDSSSGFCRRKTVGICFLIFAEIVLTMNDGILCLRI